MSSPPIDVTARGAVLLGDKVTCDGFVHEVPYRFQTHIHEDHMGEFDSSKGYQDIFMSNPTRLLLIAEFNADLQYRTNITAIPNSHPHKVGDIVFEVLSSGHMLGATQVAVTLASGTKVGYSGDFNWPLEDIIQVDGLVVDSTYGSPDSKVHHSQEELDYRFIELVLSKLSEGPIFLKAHRGLVQRAMQLLTDTANCPILGTLRLRKETDVYKQFGYAISEIIDVRSKEGKEVLQTSRYIRCYSAGDGEIADPFPGTTVHLNACLPDVSEPVFEFSERAYRVAISAHADFEGTIEYVKSTGAKFVVTDGTRGGKAAELASAIRSRLGIEARPSSNVATRTWGT